MDRDQADVLITYLEALENRVNHQSVMDELDRDDGISEQVLDDAARALGTLAGRDYAIL